MRIRKIPYLLVLFSLFLFSKTALSEKCIVKSELDLKLILNNATNCEKEGDRYIVEVGAFFPVNNPVIFPSNVKIRLKPSEKSKGFGLNGVVNASSVINLKGSSGHYISDLKIVSMNGNGIVGEGLGYKNYILNNDIQVGGDGVYFYLCSDAETHNYVFLNKIVSKNLWGLDVKNSLKCADNVNLLTVLLCSNNVTANSKSETNLDNNKNSKDDYDDYHTGNGCDGWISKGVDEFGEDAVTALAVWLEGNCGHGGIDIKDGKCLCSEGYLLGADGKCFECKADEVVKDGACVKCALNEIIQNNACVACAVDEVMQNNTCVKCPEGQVVKNGACAQTICNAATETEVQKDDGTISCVCKEGFGRYQSVDDFGTPMPCVACDPGKSTAEGTCACDKSQHKEITGACAWDSQSCSGINTAQSSPGEDCACKDGYGIRVNSDGTVSCEVTGICGEGFQWDQAKGICISIGACPEGQSFNADTAVCEPTPEPPGAAGDCGCNFGSAPVSTTQALLPYIMIGLAGVGLRLWKRR